MIFLKYVEDSLKTFKKKQEYELPTKNAVRLSHKGTVTVVVIWNKLTQWYFRHELHFTLCKDTTLIL